MTVARVKLQRAAGGAAVADGLEAGPAGEPAGRRGTHPQRLQRRDRRQERRNETMLKTLLKTGSLVLAAVVLILGVGRSTSIMT